MASNFYGLNKGQHYEKAVVGTSTGSTDVEIRVDMTKVSSRQDLFQAIKELQTVILQTPFP